MKVAVRAGMVDREYGLPKLWAMVESAGRHSPSSSSSSSGSGGDALPEALAEAALESFIRALSLTQARGWVDAYLARCVAHLRGGTCVLSALRIIHSLVHSFPADARAGGGGASGTGAPESTRAQVLASLERGGSLLAASIQELQRYTKAATVVCQARVKKGATPSELLTRPLIGRYDNATCLRRRLRFLAFVLNDTGGELAFDDLAAVAKACCTGPVGVDAGGCATFFTWLRELRFSSPGGDAGASSGGHRQRDVLVTALRPHRIAPRRTAEGEALADDVTLRVFRELLCARASDKAALRCMTEEEFECFEVRHPPPVSLPVVCKASIPQ